MAFERSVVAPDQAAHRAAERTARESYGRLLAFLVARTRDVAGAEDALAEAFASALQSWTIEGVPDNPAAWLLTVARRRQADALRRRQTQLAGKAHIELMADEIEDAANHSDQIPDRRLALMFACAHPQVERAMRAPLILQTILGLTAQDIASAFLISPATMAQRLVRAKARIKDAGIPFSIPDRDDLAQRLDAVLEAVYAAYAKGWGDLMADQSALSEEAIWLGQLVVSLLPSEPEAKGMLALMLYTQSRRQARRDSAGNYVPLEDQNITLWDDWQIDMAEGLLGEANAQGASGRYQLEAAIQSAHVARRRDGARSWPAIVALYTHLEALTGSPVVTLNRAAALAEIEGPEAALHILDTLAADRRMADYPPYWAARGHLAARAGHRSDAHNALTLAIGLSTDDAVRRYLIEQRAALCDD